MNHVRLPEGVLSQYFPTLAFKRLTPHEVDPEVSNGHELQGVSRFREILGWEGRKFQVEVLYLGSAGEGSVLRQEGELTWYDSRRGQPHRSAEWRLYYSAELTLIQEHARAADLCLVTRPAAGYRADVDLLVLIAEQGSTWEQQLIWLFGLGSVPKASRFEVRSVTGSSDHTLDFAARQLLGELGIEVHDTPDAFVEELLSEYGMRFPSTAIISDTAAQLIERDLLVDDPDLALLQLMDIEEKIFRGLEKHHVRDRLRLGFGEDVDEFISYSLSVQNRRKSRVGHALENHLARIFRANGLAFDKSRRVSDGSRPDFIFPGVDKYNDMSFPENQLSMLGSKSTCKDRWRQVLAEAARVRVKHLLTLEPAISEPQTAEMQRHALQLVVPHGLHSSYTEAQGRWLWSVAAFRDYVVRLQP